MTFGDKLREILDKKEMQQKEFAKIMNITPASLNGYVTNRRLPNILLVKEFAKELGVSVDYLLDYQPNQESVFLSSSEEAMLTTFRDLPDDRKKIVRALIEMLSQK